LLDCEFVSLQNLRSTKPYPQTLQKWDKTEVDLYGGSKDHSFSRCADGILDLIRPDVLNRLCRSLLVLPYHQNC
jgi:hypothetical protein